MTRSGQYRREQGTIDLFKLRILSNTTYCFNSTQVVKSGFKTLF